MTPSPDCELCISNLQTSKPNSPPGSSSSPQINSTIAPRSTVRNSLPFSHPLALPTSVSQPHLRCNPNHVQNKAALNRLTPTVALADFLDSSPSTLGRHPSLTRTLRNHIPLQQPSSHSHSRSSTHCPSFLTSSADASSR